MSVSKEVATGATALVWLTTAPCRVRYITSGVLYYTDHPLCVCVCVALFAVKAYVRKGHALLAMRDTMRAGQAFEKAMEIDPNNAVSVCCINHWLLDQMYICILEASSFELLIRTLAARVCTNTVHMGMLSPTHLL